MRTLRPKTLDDLPQFTVLAINTVGDEPELRGHFNRIEGVLEGRGWLYVPRAVADSPCVNLTSLDTSTHAAVLQTWHSETNRWVTVGAVLPYLRGSWDPYDVSLVLDTERMWAKTIFEPRDAQVFYDAKGTKGWCPVGQALPQGVMAAAIEKDGWDHESCHFCSAAIGSQGQPNGFTNDQDSNWVCTSCYEKYIVTHDLSFINELLVA